MNSMMNWQGEYRVHPNATIDIDPSRTTRIGKGTVVWEHAHIMPGADIGMNCIISEQVFIGSGVVIGDNVKIFNGACLFSGVTLEDGVFIGANTVTTNVLRPRAFLTAKKEDYKNLRIKTGAIVGANCTINGGLEVGKYALVGAGSVVTKQVRDFEKVFGNHAAHKGWVCYCCVDVENQGDCCEECKCD